MSKQKQRWIITNRNSQYLPYRIQDRQKDDSNVLVNGSEELADELTSYLNANHFWDVTPAARTA